MVFWNCFFDDKKKDLLEVIEKFLNTSNASDARRILEQHPELLSAEADLTLAALSRDAQNEEIIDAIENHRNFLALCREVGIAQAFEKISKSSNETSREDLQMILKEIDGLSRPQDIPRKIMLLQHALSLVQRQSNPKLWADLQVKLGNSLAQNPQGNRGDNIEQAIQHYNQALEVYTHSDSPVEWAATQNNLANAYCDRIRGNRAENIEKAIGHYNLALEVRTKKDFNVDWARTQNNLATAYWKRIKGDIAENIEKAIEHYNQALEVFTLQDFNVDWAMTQNNLAAACWSRISGDRAHNIEQAIKHFNQALKVYTHQDLPVERAGAQNNLAAAYLSRIRGDRAENIEQAIEYCKQVLKMYTPQDCPVDWAMTQNILATAYKDRILGDRAKNIEKAIENYNQALEVYTLQDFPMEWADIQNNLANAYSDRIIGDRIYNIEQAIENYNQALEVRTRQDFPVDWAMTQNNLANVYCNRILEDRAENIEQAIKHFNQALKVFTLQGFPVEWAKTQNNLATAYRDRILRDRAENIEHSISHFHCALQIYKLGSMPNDFRRTCRLLGDLYLEMGQWEDASGSYKEAIRAGDLLYRSGLSAESKTVEIGENSHLYRNSSLAACRLGLVREALLILEGGKTRLLSEALRLKMKQPNGVPNEEWRKYEQAAEKYRTATKPSDLKEDYSQREKDTQKVFEELDVAVKVVQRYNPEFQRELEIADILSIPDSETALLTFCITDKCSIGFVVSESRGIQSVDIPGFKKEDLDDLLFKPDGQGFINGGWVGDYLIYHSASWQKTLNDVLSIIGTRLLYPLLAELPPQIKRLIILPSGGLFLLPLHAVPLSNGQLFCQRYCVSYASSIQLLREMQNKAKTVEGKDLYAVINPQEDPALVFTGFEGQAISNLFNSSQMDVGETGTREMVFDRIPGRAYIHFSCHGSYNWKDPPQSGLYLVGGRTLSFADLQSDIVDMSSARLVTLSACETGITDVTKGSADEFVGLPAGFMLAGVPCVVSSLWSVPDISTAMLMEQFYSNHIIRGMDIPQALQDAQLWVRGLTSKQVADYVEKCSFSCKWEGESKENIEQYRESYLKLAEESPEEKPFQHPYYWAAFTVNGA